MNIIIGIIAYVVLTGIAVHFAEDDGVFDNNTFVESVIRISSLMLIGWLIALLIAVGLIVAGAGALLAENFLKYRSNPCEGRFSILHWIRKIVKKIIPKKRRGRYMSDKLTDGFTDRAKHILALANQEAHRWNHEYIGTEHILVGLIKESSGIGAYVLKNHDLTLVLLRGIVAEGVKPGPDMVIMGKLPQTPRVGRVLEFAVENAKSLGHNYVGTEHLLLGLLDEEESLAYQILSEIGISKAIALKEVKQLIGGFDEEDDEDDYASCYDCNKFKICSFAKSLDDHDDVILGELFGKTFVGTVRNIFELYAERCKKFERKPE